MVSFRLSCLCQKRRLPSQTMHVAARLPPIPITHGFEATPCQFKSPPLRPRFRSRHRCADHTGTSFLSARPCVAPLRCAARSACTERSGQATWYPLAAFTVPEAAEEGRLAIRSSLQGTSGEWRSGTAASPHRLGYEGYGAVKWRYEPHRRPRRKQNLDADVAS